MNRGSLTGPGILAIITTSACAFAVLAIVIMLGLLPPDDLALLGRSAE